MVDKVERVKNDPVSLLDFRKKTERLESPKGVSLWALIDASAPSRFDQGFDGDLDCIAAPPSLLPGAWRD